MRKRQCNSRAILIPQTSESKQDGATHSLSTVFLKSLYFLLGAKDPRKSIITWYLVFTKLTISKGIGTTGNWTWRCKIKWDLLSFLLEDTHGMFFSAKGQQVNTFHIMGYEVSVVTDTKLCSNKTLFTKLISTLSGLSCSICSLTCSWIQSPDHQEAHFLEQHTITNNQCQNLSHVSETWAGILDVPPAGCLSFYLVLLLS